MKIKGTLLKFGADNGYFTAISSDCKINIPKKVPFIVNFDYTIPPIGFAEVIRTDDGLEFTGEITDPNAIEALTNTYDGKECMGCGGHYYRVERNELGDIVQMELRSVSCTYCPINPEYRFEILKDKE